MIKLWHASYLPDIRRLSSVAERIRARPDSACARMQSLKMKGIGCASYPPDTPRLFYAAEGIRARPDSACANMQSLNNEGNRARKLSSRYTPAVFCG